MQLSQVVKELNLHFDPNHVNNRKVFNPKYTRTYLGYIIITIGGKNEKNNKYYVMCRVVGNTICWL